MHCNWFGGASDTFDSQTKQSQQGLNTLLLAYQAHPRLAGFFACQASKKQQGLEKRRRRKQTSVSTDVEYCIFACDHVAEELHAEITCLQALKIKHAALQAEHNTLAGVVGASASLSEEDKHPEKQKQLQSQFKELETTLLEARGDRGQQIIRLFMACEDCNKLLEYFAQGKIKGLCISCSVAENELSDLQ
jgi:hypothetical protein